MDIRVIRATPLPEQNLTVVTAKFEGLEGSYLLRPFATFTLNEVNGETSPKATFVTETGALLAHARYMGERGAMSDDFPTSKIGILRDVLIALLGEHERDGTIPTNARFLFYELIQREVLSKQRTGARRPDQILHDALTDIREDGRIPWDWIIDETRSVEDYTGYPSVLEGVLAQLPYINLDPWCGKVPFFLTESRSLAGVLRPVFIEYRVRVASTNGQCGGFLRTDVAPRLKPEDRVEYLGDYDLAGNQIEENTRDVLERVIGGKLQWKRLALTAEQVEEYQLPRIVKHDRRYKDGRPHGGRDRSYQPADFDRHPARPP